VKRSTVVVGPILLLANALTFAQTQAVSSNDQPAMPTTADQGIYISGLEVLNQKRTPDQANYFANYLGKVLNAARKKWYPQIPELQKSGDIKPGKTIVEFDINRDGSLGKTNVVQSSGDDQLDRAAEQAVTASAPYERLLETYYSGKQLKIRMHFGYNQPPSAEAPFCAGPNLGAHPGPTGAPYRVGKGRVSAPQATYSPDPEYSEDARRARYQSDVTLAGTVDDEGALTDLCVTQAAGVGLDEKAMEAVRKWRFRPATLQGQPVPVRIAVEVAFRLY
jgi:TonB family protein